MTDCNTPTLSIWHVTNNCLSSRQPCHCLQIPSSCNAGHGILMFPYSTSPCGRHIAAGGVISESKQPGGDDAP